MTAEIYGGIGVHTFFLKIVKTTNDEETRKKLHYQRNVTDKMLSFRDYDSLKQNQENIVEHSHKEFCICTRRRLVILSLKC